MNFITETPIHGVMPKRVSKIKNGKGIPETRYLYSFPSSAEYIQALLREVEECKNMCINCGAKLSAVNNGYGWCPRCDDERRGVTRKAYEFCSEVEEVLGVPAPVVNSIIEHWQFKKQGR